MTMVNKGPEGFSNIKERTEEEAASPINSLVEKMNKHEKHVEQLTKKRALEKAAPKKTKKKKKKKSKTEVSEDGLNRVSII